MLAMLMICAKKVDERDITQSTIPLLTSGISFSLKLSSRAMSFSPVFLQTVTRYLLSLVNVSARSNSSGFIMI